MDSQKSISPYFSFAVELIILLNIHRLHEAIKLRNMEGKSPTVKSLLLDIDYR